MFESRDAAGVSLSLDFYHCWPHSLPLVMQTHVNLAVHPFAPLSGLLELRVTVRQSVVSPPMFLDG